MSKFIPHRVYIFNISPSEDLSMAKGKVIFFLNNNNKLLHIEEIYFKFIAEATPYFMLQ